jgi:hypothetical protein
MQLTYRLIGFNDYIIKDKILYKKSYICKSKLCELQFRKERKIKRIFNNGIEGYILTRNGKRKFYSLKRLKHRLKAV